MKKGLSCLCAVFVSVAAYYSPSRADDSSLSTLVGGQAAVACDCKCDEKTQTFYECFHTSMNPQVETCSKTDCIVNKIWFAECPEKVDGSTCPLVNDPNAVWATQEWRNGAPAACDGVNQAAVWMKTATVCSPAKAQIRCKVDSCGGALVQNGQVRKGRMVCKKA